MMFKSQRDRIASRWKQHKNSPIKAQLLEEGLLEVELSDYRNLPGSEVDSPSGLLNDEGTHVEPITDLDIFFEQLYHYYLGKGFWSIVLKWFVEILSVVFLEFFIWFFLLVFDWKALLNVKCGVEALESGKLPCDLAKEAIKVHPLVPFTFIKAVIVGSMVILTIYGLFNFLKFILQFKNLLKIREFYYNSLNTTDQEIQTTSWPSILDKVVQLQKSHQLCVVKDLSAHDIVMRMMRKENYLIGMFNKGILALPVYWWLPGVGPATKFKENQKKYHLVLPKTLEWALNWCIFQSMFDSNFYVQRDFLTNPTLLKRRLIMVGIGMFLISPCLVIFMSVYLFLKHAEQFYNHPSTASSRRWSNLSNWIFREFNEVEHLFRYRISNSIVHATNYVKQFPSPLVTIIAKFISFVTGGVAAILIIVALVDESLLEGHIFGRNLFWYAAIFGSLAALSRAVIPDELQVFEHERAMSLVVQYTHYMPKRWRGKENSDSVRSEFESLFRYTGVMLLEELVSIFLTPILLIFVVPKWVDDILRFISDYTVYVEGVGNVCSFSVFDFEKHGNMRYGSPYDAAQDRRSSQGKMEKSFLSFHTTYTTCEPGELGRQFFNKLQTFKPDIHINQLQDYASPQIWLSTHGTRYQGQLIHRITAHAIHGYGRSFPINIGHIPSGWLNVEGIHLPYILDLYYRYNSYEKTHDSRNTPPDMRMRNEKNQELQYKRNKLPIGIENEYDNWDLPVSDTMQGHLEVSTTASDLFGNMDFQEPRQQSHFEASTSRNLLRRSSHGDQELQRTSMDHWWARTGPNSFAMETSFLEPPTYGYRDYSHPNNVVDSTTEFQEFNGSERDTSNLNNLSQTMYIGESDKDVLNLSFVDECNGSFKNLTVRIVPRSSDPVL